MKMTFRSAAFAALCGAFSLTASAAAHAQGEPEQHYAANHCEVFVDQIGLQKGSHASRILVVHVKTQNAALDGAVVEVGFRNTASAGLVWKNTVLEPFFGATDYFETKLLVGSDFGGFRFQGAFYVKTDKGTFYWSKQASGEDFQLNDETYQNLRDVADSQDWYSTKPLPTQSTVLGAFNPQQCF